MTHLLLQRCRTLAMLGLSVLALVAGVARAEETNLFGAHMQQPQILTAAESNGVFTLTCKVGFIGGCCFPLTSHDVTAALAVPPDLAMLAGPEPRNYAAIEAPPSGTPQAWATFQWRLQRTRPDTGGDLTVTVSSADSGQAQAIHALDRQSRIAVRGPELPGVLPAGQEAAIAVDAACLDPDRFVKHVRFWYSTEIPPGAEQIELPATLEERGILRFAMAGRQLMVQGKSIDLARKYEPTVWHGALPAQTHGPLHGVAVATDDAGRTAHGPVVHVAAPGAAGGVPTGGMRRWILLGALLLLAGITALVALRRPSVRAAAAAVLLVSAIGGLLWSIRPSAGQNPEPAGYPTNSSTVAFLFLDRGEASRRLSEQMETYRRAAPHRIHVVCFVEGLTPAAILNAYRDRFHVVRTPSAVFDGHALVDGTNAVAVAGTLDRCYEKPLSRLSMELHGGVIAGRQLSLGFIMCNHASRRDAHGSVSAFAVENGVPLDGWRCDHVVWQVMIEERQYAIPMGRCQAPAMMKWELPAGVAPAQVGALVLILDEEGRLIDSICTEQPCSRTGICG